MHVVFGFLDLKTHCKLSLVVRQEGDSRAALRPPGHRQLQPDHGAASTPTSACSPPTRTLADDASALFNLLTGYSQGHHWRKLVVAPERFAPPHDRADRRADRAGQRRPAVADLRQAQRAGRLPRDRGAVPRQPGRRADRPGRPRHLLPAARACRAFRRTIRVRSIVDRFLGAQPDLRVRPGRGLPGLPGQRRLDAAQFLSPRGSDVPDRIGGAARKRILEEIVPAYLRDNCRARLLKSDGTYVRLRRQRGAGRTAARSSCYAWRSPRRNC